MIARLNRRFEMGERCITPAVWRHWLWGCDLHAAPMPVFNECHLLGLLIARHKAHFEPCSMNIRLGDALPNIVFPDKMAAELTLRQLRDATEDLQMHWKQHCVHGDAVVDVMEALWARFGDINLRSQCLDDLASIDPEFPHRVGNSAIKRFVALFCVLFRHVDLETTAAKYEESSEDFDVQPYHRQAGLDAFYDHSMYADLPPASRITYKQDFTGMYHSITQVVYFHFPDYNRKRQESLEEIRKGESFLHCLSVACELRPDIPVIHEDDVWKKGWNWLLLSGGTVYLVAPPSTVLTASTMWHLLTAAAQPPPAGPPEFPSRA